MKDSVKKIVKNKAINNIQLDQYGCYRIIFNEVTVYKRDQGFDEFIFDLIARWLDNKQMKCTVYSEDSCYDNDEDTYLQYDNDEIDVKTKYIDTTSKWKDINYDVFHKLYIKSTNASKLWYEMEE